MVEVYANKYIIFGTVTSDMKILIIFSKTYLKKK